MLDGERPSALLSSKQREYLRGEADIEPGTSTEHAMRRRIRERVYHGLLDGQLVFDSLSRRGQDLIFNAWKSPQFFPEDADSIREGVARESVEFERYATGLLAFLYAGLTGRPGNAAPSEFGEILSLAIQQVTDRRGEIITEFEFTVETQPFEADDALNRFKSGEEVSVNEIALLLKRDQITSEEFTDFVDQQEHLFG